MNRLFIMLASFFGPVWNSVRGKVNAEEFIKVCVLAISTTTSIFSAMSFIYMHISQFVTDPNLITLISSIVGITTFAIDYLRRKNQDVPAKDQTRDFRPS